MKNIGCLEQSCPLNSSLLSSVVENSDLFFISSLAKARKAKLKWYEYVLKGTQRMRHTSSIPSCYKEMKIATLDKLFNVTL